MTDFATAWTTNAANFADCVARCIVVMHVATGAVSNFHRVNELCVAERCQRDDIHSLRDTTGKEARTVRAWQNANL